MSKPIYHLFLLRRPTERGLRLSEAEWNAVSAENDSNIESVGGRRVIGCDAYWCDEDYRMWGVEVFPDFAAWRKYAALREKQELYSYLDSWSLLGTWHESFNPADAVTPEPGKIYQLFLYRRDAEAQKQLAQAERDALWAKEGESRARLGAKGIVLANCYWASEEHQGFGVLMWPDIEAVQGHFGNLEQINWPRYTRARTLLGTLWGEEA